MLANGAPICYKKRRYCLFGGLAMKNSCQRTIYACYAGYVVQAVVNNFVPLLFVMFERSYQIPLSRITLLITVNFCIQLGVDLLSTWFLDRIGYRAAILLSHAFSAAGLVLLTILPDVFPDPAAGLTAAVAVYALGGGLLEVLISPIMESCPTDNKERYMSLLHSFYCWGHMAPAVERVQEAHVALLVVRRAGLHDRADQHLEEPAAQRIDGDGGRQPGRGIRKHIRQDRQQHEPRRGERVREQDRRAVADAVKKPGRQQIDAQLDAEIHGDEQRDPGQRDLVAPLEHNEQQRNKIIDDRLHDITGVAGIDRPLAGVFHGEAPE